MGQNPRRPGFRLRWGEGERSDTADTTATEAAAEEGAPAVEATSSESPVAEATAVEHPATDPDAPEGAESVVATSETASDVAPTAPGEPDATPFLRDLVGAMRGVAEASRDSSVDSVRQAVEARVAELTANGAERAEELRRTAEQDITGIGDWERTELERIRREAEQRRDARRAQLEKQLADHQAATDRDVEATRGRLADHERELEAFFAQLSEITDPAAFVAAAKRMPPPPDLTKPGEEKPAGAAPAPAAPDQKSATNGSGAAESSEETLARRLAQLDQRLSQGGSTSAAEPATPAPEAPAPADVPQTAPEPAAATGGAATAVETSTAIVVKGLGSFGAITSFKQALERVDGVRGVTLSLGPTGDFVYRASHAADFDILGAIRSLEGPNAGIEQSEGSLLVTIAGPR